MVIISGKEVGTLGFGLMGFTWRPNSMPFDKAIETMKFALECGASCWNGGEFYGPPEHNSLHLLNAYFTKYPEDADRVVINIKGGFDIPNMEPDGSEEGVKRSVENCLKLLDGKKKMDIFECARVDPKVPIEDTMRYLAEYVKAGKIGGIGLSEVGAKTIRRAAQVHPIAAVEVEFSLFVTDIKTNDVAYVCKELNIPIIAYSPLGRGFLTGAIKSIDDISGHKLIMPRFQPDTLKKNLELVKALEQIAEKKGCRPAQLAISWVRTQAELPGMPEIVAIPGATTISKVEENSKVVSFTDAELKEIDDILESIPVHGGRYPPGRMSALTWA